MPCPVARLSLSPLEARLTPTDIILPASGTGFQVPDDGPIPPEPTAVAALDPTFGTGGVVELRPTEPGQAYPGVTTLVPLPDGKTLLVGQLRGFFAARLLADGTPDLSFGTNGRVSLAAEDLPFPLYYPRLYSFDAAVATPDGGVVIVGNASRSLHGSDDVVRVVKLTADGSLDRAFMDNANAGVFDLTRSERATGAALLPGGRVVIIGTSAASGGGFTHTDGGPVIVAPKDQRAAVFVLRPDGTPDPTFSGDGRLLLGTDSGFDVAAITAVAGRFDSLGVTAADVAMDAAGRVVIAGTVSPVRDTPFKFEARAGFDDRAFTGARPFAARLLADGRLDVSFAGDGVAEFTLPVPAGELYRDAQAGAVGVDATGRVLVGASRSLLTVNYTLTRLTAAGAVDTGYGSGGFVTINDPRPVIDFAAGTGGEAVVVTGNHRYLAGQLERNDTYGRFQGVYRVDGAGAVSYVGNVRVAADDERLLVGSLYGAVAVGPAGEVTVAGLADTEFDGRVRLARLAERLPVLVVDPPLPPPPPLPVSGDLDGDFVADRVVVDGPRVSVVSGADGRVLVPAFAPFEASYTGALNAVLADVDGNQLAELVVAPDAGGGPVVAVYAADGRQLARFWGIDDPNFRGGARLAAGDLDGDGRAELVVTAGAGGGPRVAVFDGRGVLSDRRKLVGDFFAFEEGQRGGAYVLVEDLEVDGTPDLVFGAGPGGGPRVRAVSAPGLRAGGPIRSLDDVAAEYRKGDRFVGDPNARAGVRLSVRRPAAGESGFPELVGDPGTGRPELVYSLVRPVPAVDRGLPLNGVEVG